MTTKHTLESKSLTSKITLVNIKNILSSFVSYKKSRVQEVGQVLYIKDKEGKTIAHAYKEEGELILLVK